jgi:hypothetical protein
MTNELDLPDWLPPPVTAFVHTCAHAEYPWDQRIWGNETLRARLLRLTTCQRMQSVWKLLSTAEFKPDALREPDSRRGRVSYVIILWELWGA